MNTNNARMPLGASIGLCVGTAIVSTLLSAFVLQHHLRIKNENDDKNDELSDDSVPPKSILEFEKQAAKILRGTLGEVYYGYVDGEGTTAKACRDAFRSIRLLPKILVGDLSNVDTTLSIFGDTLEIPVLAAPTAFHSIACEDGEVATARGTGAAGVGFCYNWMLATRNYHEVLKESGPKWLHIYMFDEKDLVEKSIRAAEATGSFSAIVITCDHPHTRVQFRMVPKFKSIGFPEREKGRPFFPNQAEVGYESILLDELLSNDYSKTKPPGGTNSEQLSWKDVEWIKSLTKLPIVAKGILSAEDARLAVRSGADAIVVSNHGGRQWDGAPPALEALPAVVAAVANEPPDVPVFVDTGVRTSTDIVRALCLGAKGVMLGRPIIWGIACGGSEGLERMLTALKEDLKADMQSLGVKSLDELNASSLWPPDRERIEVTIRSCGEKVPW